MANQSTEELNNPVSDKLILRDNPSDDNLSSETANSLENFKFSSSPNLEEIRKLLKEFVQEREWNQYHTPRNLLLAMVGEVGELAELFQWRGEVQEGLPDWTEDEKEHLGQELSDVLIYLVGLSAKCGIDLPAAVVKKMASNKAKYPAEIVKGSSKKYTEYQVDKC